MLEDLTVLMNDPALKEINMPCECNEWFTHLDIE